MPDKARRDVHSAKPEGERATFELPLRRVAGTWSSLALSGAGILRLDDEAWELALAEGLVASGDYGGLSGAEWRADMLSLHSISGSVHVEAEAGLDRAWVRLTSLACPLDEFTRALRWLGSNRAGDASAQARFFAPFLQARRLLEDEADLDRRLSVFSATVLTERMAQVLRAMAQDAYRRNPPDRRALEAELLEATAPLFARLRDLEDAATRFRTVGDAERFKAWRHWLHCVSQVFAGADFSWRLASTLLPAPRVGRRRWWRRRLPIALLSLGAAAAAAWGARA